MEDSFDPAEHHLDSLIVTAKNRGKYLAELLDLSEASLNSYDVHRLAVAGNLIAGVLENPELPLRYRGQKAKEAIGIYSEVLFRIRSL